MGWISHSITTQHITLLKQPNLNTTLLHCGINVSWMHYIGFFQQSSLPLWPGHDHLSTFFTFRNLLSTFVTPAMARWYPESWTTSKAWKKLILGNANNSELIFLARFATSIGCVSFVVAILCSRSCPYWTIRIKKCIYARHMIITANVLIGYVHWTTSPCMCVDMHQCVATLLGVVLQSK